MTVTQAGSNDIAANALVTLDASGLRGPDGVAVDANGNVYIADNNNNAIDRWDPTTQQVTPLVSSGLSLPGGLAVDAAGNVYIADGGDNTVKEWVAATQQLITLVSTGLSGPYAVAVDGAGNVYIADTFDNAIKEWVAGTKQVIPLVSSGLAIPEGVAVDQLGNVYIADTGDGRDQGMECNNAASQHAGLVRPVRPSADLAVDGSGNVRYIADTHDNAVDEWQAATQQVTTRVSSGLSLPWGVTVDGAENIYVADAGDSAIDEIVNAYVPSGPVTEGPAAGSDSLTIVPSSQPFTGVYAPTSDQNWLTIGTTGNGVVHFSFTANPGSTSRTAQIAVLGQQISVTQYAPPVANPDTAQTNRETPVAINVLANDSDANGYTLTVQSVTTPSFGTAVINADNSITYTPATNFVGIDLFQYTISDGRGGTATASVTVTVNYIAETRTWTGGGTNDLWSNPANWNLLPEAGDSLVFSGTPETTQNDFPAGAAFGGIALQNTTPQYWTLQGNGVTLSGPDAIVNSTQPFNGGSYEANDVDLAVTLGGDAAFHGQGTSDLEVVGGININGYTLTLGSSVDNGLYDFIEISDLTGAGSLTSVADPDREVYVSGNNPFTGSTVVNGDWYIAGSLGSSSVDVTSTGGVRGTGTINAPVTVENGGNLGAGRIGSLATGSLSLASGSAVTLAMAAPTPGSYDQFNVQGNVSLGGATLNASLATAPNAGAQFEIIDNQGSNPVSSTFAGLPEGTVFSISGYPFRISYQGGDGNDVVLTALAPLAYTAGPITGPPPLALQLDNTGTNLQILSGNTIVASQALADTTAINITGNPGGSDTLTLDYANGYFSVPIDFNGGGTGSLNITGGSLSNITDNPTGAGAGTLVLQPTSGSNTTVTYTGLAPIDASVTAANVTIDLPANVQDALLTSSGTPGMETISSPSGAFESLTFADPTGTLTIDGNSTDKLQVQSLSSSFDANLVLRFARW